VKGASGWPTTPITTLADPKASAQDNFGWSVAVHGTSVVVGAPGTSTGGAADVGAAYIYVKGTSGWPTTPTVKLSDPAATANDHFGYSVAVHGTSVVVGDPEDDGGAAYIYVKGASGWPKTPTIKLSNPASTFGAFGVSVAVSTKTAVVGAFATNSFRGAAYIYVWGASGWPKTPTTTLTDPKARGDGELGWSVAVHGTSVVVGAPGTSTGGDAYVYVKGASGWPKTPTIKLADPVARMFDLFGSSVSVSGRTVVVGAVDGGKSGTGAAYIYVKGASGWPTTPTTTLTDPSSTGYNFAGSVAAFGGTAIVGATGNDVGAGAAYIYKA
jgi:hypothetical protein